MNSCDIWHVDVQNNIYEATYEEVIEWIKEGAILPDDKVRRGNLRWLNAGKVPEFHRYFFENIPNETFSPAPNKLNGENEELFTHFQTGAENFSAPGETAVNARIGVSPLSPNARNSEQSKAPKIYVASDVLACSVHSDRELSYVCQICKLYFCKTCPHSFGSSVKICLDCGGLCITYEDFEKLNDKTIGAINRPYARVAATIGSKENEQSKRAKLATKDFTAALAYPLKFPVALLTGAVLLTILTLGQTVLAIGGINLFTVAAGVSVLTLMLIFSVQMKTVENCVREKTENGFLPGINRFTFWEDLIHPLFLGTGVFLASFGLFIALTVGAGVYAWTQFSEDLKMAENERRSSAIRVNTVLDNLDDGEVNGGARGGDATFEHKIEQNLQNQTERVFGLNYLGDTAQLDKFWRSMLRLSVYFQMPVGFAFIFGLLVFPAICLIAASTRSFGKTVNLWRSFQIIKQIGFDYIKILVTQLTFLMAVIALVSGTFITLSFFEQSFVGVVAGLTIGGLAAFYLWVSFSKILGIALFKKQIQERI